MKNRLSNLVVIFIFIIILGVGILVHKDYGIPWDESIQIQIGALNYRYLMHADPALLSAPDRYYGALFEVPLLWGSARFSISRHLLIFLIFFTGLIFFYALGSRLFHNRWWSLLAVLLLASSPRIFADSFYNSKDIPFLTITIISIWTLILLSDALKKGQILLMGYLLILHSIASAAMISTRVAGVMIIPLTVLVVIANLLINPTSWAKYMAVLAGYLVLATSLTILFWPILWHDPWGSFIQAFRQMSRYPFNRPVLYFGQFYFPTELPWHYLPVWIGLTTPLIVSVGLFLGILAGGKSIWILFKGVKKDHDKTNIVRKMRDGAIVAAWLVIPLAAIYLFHSVLYDAWRQMFFIYPAIILIGAFGFRSMYGWLLNSSPSKVVVTACMGLLCLVGLAEPVWFMVRYHPFENVYFNALAGDPLLLRSRFELDYWGLSYKQAIDRILLTDPRQPIKISVANPPGFDYINSGLPIAQKSRIIQVKNIEDANYFVTEFRWHPQDYPYNKVYSISVRGMEIMAVYRIH